MASIQAELTALSSVKANTWIKVQTLSLWSRSPFYQTVCVLSLYKLYVPWRNHLTKPPPTATKPKKILAFLFYLWRFTWQCREIFYCPTCAAGDWLTHLSIINHTSYVREQTQLWIYGLVAEKTTEFQQVSCNDLLKPQRCKSQCNTVLGEFITQIHALTFFVANSYFWLSLSRYSSVSRRFVQRNRSCLWNRAGEGSVASLCPAP